MKINNKTWEVTENRGNVTRFYTKKLKDWPRILRSCYRRLESENRKWGIVQKLMFDYQKVFQPEGKNTSEPQWRGTTTSLIIARSATRQSQLGSNHFNQSRIPGGFDFCMFLLLSHFLVVVSRTFLDLSTLRQTSPHSFLGSGSKSWF